jgi:hypothetical protein
MPDYTQGLIDNEPWQATCLREEFFNKTLVLHDRQRLEESVNFLK